MNPLELLLTRKSHNKLMKPAPNEQQLEIMFKAALRAPDHALLRPWQYRVYEGEGLDKLGHYFAEATLSTEPELTPEKLDRIRNKPHRAPMVIVASVVIKEHSKVPRVEQVLSAGASVQNLLMAAHFQKIGAIWRTGNLAFNSKLMRLIGLSKTEEIVGFIYLGTEDGEKRKAKDFDISDFVSRIN